MPCPADWTGPDWIKYLCGIEMPGSSDSHASSDSLDMDSSDRAHPLWPNSADAPAPAQPVVDDFQQRSTPLLCPFDGQPVVVHPSLLAADAALGRERSNEYRERRAMGHNDEIFQRAPAKTLILLPPAGGSAEGGSNTAPALLARFLKEELVCRRHNPTQRIIASLKDRDKEGSNGAATTLPLADKEVGELGGDSMNMKEELVCKRHNLTQRIIASLKDRDKEGSTGAATTLPLADKEIGEGGGVGRKRTHESDAPPAAAKLRRMCIDAAGAAAAGQTVLTGATAPGRICIDAAAAAASRTGDALWANGEEALRRRVARADVMLQAWWRASQREQMTLAAWIAGKGRQEILNLPEARNCSGQVVGYIEPEPIDFDRIHIKVWPPQPDDNPWYICILDAKYGDTIASLKNKIWTPEMHITFHDVIDERICSNGEKFWQKRGFTKEALKVFYKGRAMSDLKTLEEESLVDDCILHICDPQRSPCMGVISTQLHQWRDLRTKKQGGKWPAPSK